MLVLFSLIAGAVLFTAFDESPITGGLLGLLLAWVYQLSEQVRHLQQRLTHSQQTSEIIHQATTPVITRTSHVHVAEPALITATPTHSSIQPDDDSEQWIPAPTRPQPERQPTPPQGTVLDKAFTAAWDWLVGGNPFVRAGIVLLFLGVVFLLRYSLEHNLIPVEMRLAGAAAGALALLAYGWKLRERAGSYGLILQAGGVGLLYLTVFGAFSLYNLLPATPAFALLVVIVAAAAGLAVMQNSLPMAAYATVGGFLAPLLTSTDSNNYIGLFSFYAILNAGIVGIAWFRSWRLLNLLGFVFTFVIASLWGWHSYQPENFNTTEPFLILFFVFYVAIAVLFATRTPVSFKDKVDGTLVFGTPLLGFGMQVALVRQFEYGIAISAAVVGVFYLLARWGIRLRFGKAQQLLADTFLALGVIFLTLAIPFAVDGVATSSAWALEGAGILWVSIRQQQWLRRLFAILLHYAALLALLWGMAFKPLPAGAMAFFNEHFLTMLLVAAAMLVSSRLLSAHFVGKRGYEQPLAIVLLLSGLLFLTALFELQIVHFSLDTQFIDLHLAYALLVCLLLLAMGWLAEWSLLRILLLLPVLLAGMALLGLAAREESLLLAHGWWLWPANIAGLYAVLFRYQQRGWLGEWLVFMQVALVWLVLLLLSHETHVQMLAHFVTTNAWYVASLPLAGIAGLWWLMRGKWWPVPAYQPGLLLGVGIPLAGLLALWLLASLRHSGDSSPLPWLPLLNPLDAVALLLGVTCLSLYRTFTRQQIFPALAMNDARGKTVLQLLLLLAFLWLNVVWLRAQHHWGGLPWVFPDLLAEPSTQTGLAILWTLTGLVLTWRGNRTGSRLLWSSGASLLAAVVLKLFVVDFASSGTLARIASFLSVGILLLFIGYLAPLPPAEKPAPDAG